MRAALPLSVVAMSLCALCVLAQTQPPAKPQPPAIVIINKTEGPAVRGTIVSADPDHVVIQPARKPADKSDPEQQTLTWKQIKTISSGLTYAKVLADWKVEHHDQLCPTCHGNRTQLCAVCKGTNHDPAAAVDCKTCKGELLVDCKVAKCDEGKVPCPNNCLKRYEGQWVKQDDKMVRFFTSSQGRAWFSEAHVGDVIVTDKKTGVISDAGKCPVCGGTTYVECQVCEGLGKIPCPTCAARKEAPACPAHCDDGKTVCETCKGTGLKV